MRYSVVSYYLFVTILRSSSVQLQKLDKPNSLKEDSKAVFYGLKTSDVTGDTKELEFVVFASGINSYEDENTICLKNAICNEIMKFGERGYGNDDTGKFRKAIIGKSRIEAYDEVISLIFPKVPTPVPVASDCAAANACICWYPCTYPSIKDMSKNSKGDPVENLDEYLEQELSAEEKVAIYEIMRLIQTKNEPPKFFFQKNNLLRDTRGLARCAIHRRYCIAGEILRLVGIRSSPDKNFMDVLPEEAKERGHAKRIFQESFTGDFNCGIQEEFPCTTCFGLESEGCNDYSRYCVPVDKSSRTSHV